MIGAEFKYLKKARERKKLVDCLSSALLTQDRVNSDPLAGDGLLLELALHFLLQEIKQELRCLHLEYVVVSFPSLIDVMRLPVPADAGVVRVAEATASTAALGHTSDTLPTHVGLKS